MLVNIPFAKHDNFCCDVYRLISLSLALEFLRCVLISLDYLALLGGLVVAGSGLR